jgi:DNA-binding beta-propeller fold protein YncE
MARRSRLLVAATAVALAVAGVAAVAASGSFTYQGCMANDGLDGCRKPAHNSLGNNVGLAVSPDGSNVYVAAFEGTLTDLQHGSGGALTYEGCFADGGARDCRDIPHDSLKSATGVAVSPDGRSVYVTTGQRTNSVTRFKRDPTGTLGYRSCISNGGAQAGIGGCSDARRNSLDSNEAVTVSPDGDSVYVANGALRYRNCIANGGAHGCKRPKHDSLGGAYDVAVSPDGKSLYAVALNGDSITRFDRRSDGSLVYKNCFANARAHGCRALKHNSLGGADAVTVSADGKSVYVAALGGDSITHFARSPSGRLAPKGCYANSAEHDCAAPKKNSLHAANGVAVSADGQQVYVTAMTGPTMNGGPGAVSEFRRRADGSLGSRGCFADNGRYDCREPRLDSLGSPQSVAVDPQGADVFVGSYGFQLSIFRRSAGSP